MHRSFRLLCRHFCLQPTRNTLVFTTMNRALGVQDRWYVCVCMFLCMCTCVHAHVPPVLWLHIWYAGIYRSGFLFQWHDCTFLRGTALCLAVGNMHYRRVTLGVCKRHLLQVPPSPTLQCPWCTCHWHKLVSALTGYFPMHLNQLHDSAQFY
jgi:hypothetical protein